MVVVTYDNEVGRLGMADRGKRAAAKAFVKHWQDILRKVKPGQNNEQQDTQKFWVDLLTNVLGVPSTQIPSYADF